VPTRAAYALHFDASAATVLRAESSCPDFPEFASRDKIDEPEPAWEP